MFTLDTEMSSSHEMGDKLVNSLRDSGLDGFYNVILHNYLTFVTPWMAREDSIIGFLENNKDIGILQDPDVIGSPRFANLAEIEESHQNFNMEIAYFIFTPLKSFLFRDGRATSAHLEEDGYLSFYLAIDTNLVEGDYFIYKDILFRVIGNGTGVSLEISYDVFSEHDLIKYSDEVNSIDIVKLFREGTL